MDPYKGVPLSVLFCLVRLAGVRHAEVTRKFLDVHAATLRTVRGMSLGLHLPNAGLDGYDFSSNSHTLEIQAVIDQVHRLSKEISFQYVVCHPPESPEKNRSLDLYFEFLCKLNLPLVLENIQTCAGQNFIEFHAQCRQELKDLLFGVCLDIPHAKLSGDDWQALFQHFGLQIRVIHLSDTAGDEDRHAPFRADGTLPLESILDYLLEQNYQGILNFEILPEGLQDVRHMFLNIRKAQRVFGK